MNINNSIKFGIFFIIFLLIAANFLPSFNAQLKYPKNNYQIPFDDGKILYAPMYDNTIYLIEKNGDINHTWSSSYLPGQSVYLLGDGSILYTNKLSLQGGGAGGGVQQINWDGEIIWEYTYYTGDYLSHHDIEPLPNGNVLMIAWEHKTRMQALEEGRNPNKLVGNILSSLHVIEVEPTGLYSGDIVWKWHAWDHLIQDYDPSKDNYGIVADHPELIDINYGSIKSDWLHTNSIDYNEEFDQILLSVRNFDEIWIIDHSTTIQEAAGHSGGNSGKGGDLLYRWGNPDAYGAGSSNDQKFFDQHDARWIKPGCPGEGNILVFNNGVGRPGSDIVSIDEIVPPVDDEGNYLLETGSSFGPDEQIWIFNTDFFANVGGGTQRIENGNTLICDCPGGEFYEVTYNKEVIWEYENTYPNPINDDVFKIIYYTQIIEPNEPPNEPYNPSPQNGDDEVNINQQLHWNCNDPDYDNLFFDVYFEADNPVPNTLVSNNQSSMTYRPINLNVSTDYYWQIVAWDDQGESNTGPIWMFTTREKSNILPEAYIDSISPNPANVGQTISFIGHGTDDDGNVIDYHWESDLEGVISEERSFELDSLSTGTHIISFKVKDNDLEWSEVVTETLIILEEDNHPPQIPQFSGKTNGNANTEYEYTISTIDPDEDQIYYYIDWGDGDIIDWDGPYNSSQEVIFKHIWTEKESYIIQYKAKDIHDLESEWGTLDVEMPKYKNLNNLFSLLINNYPSIARLLKILLNLIF